MCCSRGSGAISAGAQRTGTSPPGRWRHRCGRCDMDGLPRRSRQVAKPGAKVRSHSDRSYPRAFSTWTRSRVFSAGTRVATMPCLDRIAGSTPTLPRAPNSPPSIVSTLKVRRADETSASVTRAAASPSVGAWWPEVRKTVFDTRADLRQDALQRIAANGRLAPGDHEAARRCTKHGESDFRR